MLELANTRTQHASVEWAQLGPGGAWFLLFTDGAYFWGGNIGSDMQEDLDSAKNQQGVHRLYMASEECDKYLLEFGDGTTSWRMSDGFTRDYKALHEAIDNGAEDDSEEYEEEDGHVTKSMVVDKGNVGAIIVKRGSTVKQIQQATGARVRVMIARDDSGAVTISGTQGQVAAAKAEITALMQELGSRVTASMVVDTDIVGTIIGKGGRTVNWIQQATGARVVISRDDSGTVTISGTQGQVAAAKAEITAVIQTQREKQAEWEEEQERRECEWEEKQERHRESCREWEEKQEAHHQRQRDWADRQPSYEERHRRSSRSSSSGYSGSTRRGNPENTERRRAVEADYSTEWMYS
jgi:transcription antitermination factor NusA-like protein